MQQDSQAANLFRLATPYSYAIYLPPMLFLPGEVEMRECYAKARWITSRATGSPREKIRIGHRAKKYAQRMGLAWPCNATPISVSPLFSVTSLEFVAMHLSEHASNKQRCRNCAWAFGLPPRSPFRFLPSQPCDCCRSGKVYSHYSRIYLWVSTTSSKSSGA